MSGVRVMVAMGTRPEAIKLTSVVKALRERGVTVDTWHTGQSPDLAPVNRGEWGNNGWRDLPSGIADILTQFQHEPDAVIVQGDTATAFAVALAAFLADVPVAHVEAGLRTYQREPYPEEAFRSMIARMARWHFAPDANSGINLWNEIVGPNLPKGLFREAYGIHVVGNPGIDALNDGTPFRVLVTLHRRENWGERILDAITQLHEFAQEDNVHITVIRHPNWETWLEGTLNSFFLNYVNPVEHKTLLDWLVNADVVVTDSGGLQEEAAYFGVPCLVYRTATERTALLESGAVELVDPDHSGALKKALEAILSRRRAYGNGDAGERIASILVEELTNGS